MKIFQAKAELQFELQELKKQNRSIGFVPTMGALHEGHLSLIQKSKAENDFTVCSIFVNPTQFNDENDLLNYPRMPEKDIAMLEKENCDIVFMPVVDEMYTDQNLITLDFGMLDKVMEGMYRPNHFRGMATVVNKFFEIVNPDNAYFGEKDFQQLAIIKFMVKQLQLKVKITGCHTLREKDGLAMSSRNLLLTKSERKNASAIYQSFLKAKESFAKNSVKEIKNKVIETINAVDGFKVQYFEIVNSETLQSISHWDNTIETRACIAVLTSAVRLIDNIAL